jgi:hypothetical protein
MDSTRPGILLYFIYYFILCAMHSVCTEEEFCELWERIDNLKWKKVFSYFYSRAVFMCGERSH